MNIQIPENNDSSTLGRIINRRTNNSDISQIFTFNGYYYIIGLIKYRNSYSWYKLYDFKNSLDPNDQCQLFIEPEDALEYLESNKDAFEKDFFKDTKSVLKFIILQDAITELNLNQKKINTDEESE